jgi:hypothetical protein
MIDILLSFPSFEVATQVGVALGYVQVDDIMNPQVIETIQATFDMAICVIGEHWVPTDDLDEEGNSVMVGDGKWWVLVRSLVNIELPEPIQPFIAWVSTSGEPMPDNVAVPKRQWA